MIARDIYPLAWTLQAHVPDPRIRDTVGDPLLQNAVADRRMATCQQAGLADRDARVMGEALAGYLSGRDAAHGGHLRDACGHSSPSSLGVSARVRARSWSTSSGGLFPVLLDTSVPGYRLTLHVARPGRA